VFDAGMTRLLLAVAAIAFVAVGCGAAENDPNLAAAADRTEATGSGRFEVNGAYEENGTPTSIACTGSADYERRRVTVSCTYEGVREFEAIAIGGDVYLRGDAAFGPGTRDKWVRESGEVDEDTALANLSPQRLLTLLRDASSETARAGEEDVRGEPTVRYRLTVDCDSADLDCADSGAVDVWIADDGIVRRIAIDDDGGQVTFEFFDFGADVDIQAPPEAQVEDLDGSAGSSGTGSCGEGPLEPVTVKVAAQALRTHGFSVEAQQPFCAQDVDSYPIVSTVDASQHFADQPSVSCGVTRLKASGTRKLKIEVHHAGAAKELEFENLDCTLYAEGAAKEDAITRLEAAFDDVRAATR